MADVKENLQNLFKSVERNQPKLKKAIEKLHDQEYALMRVTFSFNPAKSRATAETGISNMFDAMLTKAEENGFDVEAARKKVEDATGVLNQVLTEVVAEVLAAGVAGDLGVKAEYEIRPATEEEVQDLLKQKEEEKTENGN